MKKVIWLVAMVSLFLAGCFLPEKFESKVDIQKDGSYTLSYDGTIAYAPALNRKISAKDEKKLESMVKDIKKDPNIKEAKYLGNARYQITMLQKKKAGEKAYFFDKRANIISVIPNGKSITISTKKLAKRDLAAIKKLNFKVDGKIVVSIPDNMKFEGTKPDSTPTLGFGNYEWNIDSFDKSINIKVVPK